MSDPGEERTSVFLRGLTFGALIGAIIAGSTFWTRRRQARRRRSP